MTDTKKSFFNDLTGKDVVLSFQHMFAMLGATITVPLLCNMSIPMALIAAGLGTILFFFISKKMVPVFLGSSFAFMAGYQTILGGLTMYSADWNKGMAAIAIALVLAGLVYVAFSFAIKAVGLEKVKKLFPPIVIGPVIIIIGMNLAGSIFWNDIIAPGFNSAKTGYGWGGAGTAAWKHWTTAVVTAITIIGFNAYAKPKSFLKVIPILLGFVIGYIYALIVSYIPDAPGVAATKLVDFTAVWNDGHLAKDNVIIFQNLGREFGFYKGFGEAGFGTTLVTAILCIVPISIVTFMEHLGDINANSVVCGQDFMVEPGLHRTVLGDGIATAVSGLLGGPANTTYGENTAVLAITKNYNTRNVFMAACFAIFFGVFSIFGDFLRTLPVSVVGGACVVLFGMIAANGLRALVEGKVDFGNSKNMIVVSVTLAVGLGLGAMELAAAVTGENTLQVGFAVSDGGFVKISALAISTVLAIVLNLIIPNGKKEAAEAEEATTEEKED